MWVAELCRWASSFDVSKYRIAFLEDEGNMILRNVYNFLTSDTAYKPIADIFSAICIKYIYIYYFLTYLLTYSMQRSPWEANRFSASQEIPRILWNPKFHYRSYKSPLSLPILSQFDPVRTPTSHFLMIHLNIILSSTPGSLKWSPFLRFPHQNPVYPHTCYTPRPSNYSRFYHPNNIGWAVQIIKLPIM